MESYKYIIVSEENGLYDKISRKICEENPGVQVSRADTVREGVAILESTGKGIILADIGEVLKKMPFAHLNTENDSMSDNRFFHFHGTDADEAELASVKYYIRMHLKDDLRISTIASNIGLSPNYLSKIFKESEGQTIHEYVEINRMQRAAYLILTEEDSIEEIARKVGYVHVSHFCRTFKKFFELTPLQYRIQHRSRIWEEI